MASKNIVQTTLEPQLAERVKKLKEQEDAVILAHYYVPEATQELADYVGDSFFLARLARTLECKTIVICGVSFMGESVKLLNPERRVLSPDLKADCPMAHMVKKEDVEAARKRYSDLAVVCYVNSTAQMKAWSDVCVTSSNAVKVVRQLPQKNILFIPDQNLGRYVASQVPQKNVILNPGYCPIHQNISAAAVEKLMRQHPGAEVLAHPECCEKVVQLAGVVGSTKEIISRIAQSDASDFIVCTVAGVQHEIAKQATTEKHIWFPDPTPLCPDMALLTPEKVLEALETGSGEVALPDDADRARLPLERMLELSAK
jgi:quinolinate synthase